MHWNISTLILAIALIAIIVLAGSSPGFRSDVSVIASGVTARLPAVTESASPWDGAIRTPDGGRIGVITANVVNVRSEPSLDAPAVDSLFERHLVTIFETVSGDDVEGETDWYRVGDGKYLTGAFAEPFEPRDPGTSLDGRWVDIDLSRHYAVAYEGGTPVFAAILLTGRAGWDTPEGDFEVIRRAESETMDAATIGIPEDAPNYYYLEDVPYVQYFAEGGYAIHGNDWSPPEAFGNTGSHGCINMQVADAAFFWDFLSGGSPVRISY